MWTTDWNSFLQTSNGSPVCLIATKASACERRAVYSADTGSDRVLLHEITLNLAYISIGEWNLREKSAARATRAVSRGWRDRLQWGRCLGNLWIAVEISDIYDIIHSDLV